MNAFSGQDTLLSVTLPASIQAIEETAFAYCTNVTVNVLGAYPGTLSYIGLNAFLGVTSVENVNFGYTGQPWDQASSESPQWVESLYDAAGGEPDSADAPEGGEEEDSGEASGSGDPYITSMLM